MTEVFLTLNRECRMKLLSAAIVLAVILTAPAAEPAAGIFDGHICNEIKGNNLTRGEDVELDIEDDAITFIHDRSDETVTITEDYQLLINGRPVPLKRSERKLVMAYYRQFEKVIEEAKEIGLEGARVGASGVKIALKAVGSALAGMADDGETDRLEEELEDMEDEIEEQAGELEKRAEEIEEEAEELEDLHRDLRKKIEELDDLGWF
jgi:hypothetical protein